MVWLEVVGASGEVVRFPVSSRPMFVGRDPTNDVVLSDDTVSNRHLSVWVEDGKVRVEDLRSTNGTRIEGKAVTGVRDVESGTQIEVGKRATRLVIRADEAGRDPSGAQDQGAAATIEDVTLGLRHTLNRDRFVVGPSPDANVQLVDVEDNATLMVHPNGEVWLGQDTTELELNDGDTFEVGSHTFRFHRASMARQATQVVTASDNPWVLQVTLDGPTGPEAHITRNDGGPTKCAVSAENRATLLYVLGRRFQDESQAGLTTDIAGWCTDHEVIVGVWGRSALDNPTNSLHVLISRIRKELKKSGIDPWIIEKRRGHLRVRVDSVEVS